MVQILPMSTSLREEMLRYVPRTDDPEIRARQKHVARVLLDMDPELRQEVSRPALEEGRKQGMKKGRKQGLEKGLEKGLKQGLKQGLEKGVDQGRLVEARVVLRRVLARRELSLSTEDEARIKACADLATLERWLDQAIVAPSDAEALHGSAAP